MYVPKSKKLMTIINEDNMLIFLKEDKAFKSVFNSNVGNDINIKTNKNI